ncbi:MAG: hypothetical protein U0231_15080 [Nitrospiraceae bacterium]
MPCGFSKTGLPIGMQLIGRAFEEDMLPCAAHAYEQTTNWRMKKPSIRYRRGRTMIVEIAARFSRGSRSSWVGPVPLPIQMRKTVAESNSCSPDEWELPTLITELRAMSQNLNDLADQARGGVEHAAVLLHAVGEVGRVGSAGSRHGAGIRRVAGQQFGQHGGGSRGQQVVKERMKEGGHHNGG